MPSDILPMIRDIAIIVMAVMVTAAARSIGAKIFFADEAHFQADADPVSGYWAGSARQVGAQRGTGPGGLHQPAPGREGQLLFGGVPGDRGGGGDGTGGQQQRCHRNHLPAATAGAAYRTADGDLGQFDSPPGHQPGGPRRRNRRDGRTATTATCGLSAPPPSAIFASRPGQGGGG